MSAYPGATDITDNKITTQSGTQNATTHLTYYPIGDARQGLLSTKAESSVDTAGQTATTTYTYTGAGLLTSASKSGYSSGQPLTIGWSATYDTRGRVQTLTGPRTDLLQRWTYNYYSDSDSDLARRGQLQSITDPLGHAVSYASAPAPYNTYTMYGDSRSTINENNVVTASDFDNMGRPLTSTLRGTANDPADLVTRVAYDAAGRQTSLVKPLSNGLQWSYDSANNNTGRIRFDSANAQHEQLAFGFDAMSELTGVSAQQCTMPSAACLSWTTAMSRSYQYGTDGSLALASVSYPTGGSSAFTYDSYVGTVNKLTVGDSNFGIRATYVSDGQELLTNVAQGTWFSNLNFTHDLAQNLDSISQTWYRLSLKTTYPHDDFGRVTKTVSPTTGTTTYAYDGADNVTSTTDANGAVTTTTYDALDRSLTQSSARTGLTTETVTRTYDNPTANAFGVGRLATVTDPSGSTAYTYERRGNVASRQQVINGNTYSTAYTYDANGNVKTATLPSARILSYGYDFADRPYSVRSGNAQYVASASYAPFGPRSQLVFGNGTTQTNTYTQRYLPAELKVTNATGTLADYTYTENGAGYITGVADALNANYSRTYAYGDYNGNALTTATTGSALWGNGTYTSSCGGNYVGGVLCRLTIPGNTFNVNYNFNTLRLATVYNAQASHTIAVSNDAAGNQTAFDTSTYAYSPRDHLSSGDGVSYAYDGDDQRVLASSSAGSRAYLYDLDDHLQSESALQGSVRAYDYIWFDDVPVSQEDNGGQTHWTAVDHLGAPFLQTDGSAAAYWQADYTPYGQVYALRTADAHQPLRFPGQEAEQFTAGQGPNGATPRYYNGARWYIPKWGKYTQPDPDGLDASPWDLYDYASTNPINEIDPSGRTAMPFSGGINGAASHPGASNTGVGPLPGPDSLCDPAPDP